MTPSLIPVHVVVYNCKTPQSLEQFQRLAEASRARFHVHTPPPAATAKNTPPPAATVKKSEQNPLLSSFSSLSSAGSGGKGTSRPQSAVSTSGRSISRPQSAVSTSAYHGDDEIEQNSPSFPPSGAVVSGAVLTPAPNTEDTCVLAEEIELARNTLAEVQALRLEVGMSDLLTSQPAEPEISEESLTSQQWLEVRQWVLPGPQRNLQIVDIMSSVGRLSLSWRSIYPPKSRMVVHFGGRVPTSV